MQSPAQYSKTQCDEVQHGMESCIKELKQEQEHYTKVMDVLSERPTPLLNSVSAVRGFHLQVKW